MTWLWRSKTLWVAIFIAGSTAFSAQIQEWIISHPGIAGSAVSFVMLLLRAITTKAMWEKGKPVKCEHPECPL